MDVRFLPAADRRPQPWRNGGGITREVAIHPEGAGIDDFVWRISMAEISEPGPFSAFPAIERVLAVLHGALTLRIDTAAPKLLTPGSPPFRFAGDAACHASPLAGTVTDLNVMTRANQTSATVRYLTAANASISGTALVLAPAPLAVTFGPLRYALDRYDALLITAPGDLSVSATAVLVEIVDLRTV